MFLLRKKKSIFELSSILPRIWSFINICGMRISQFSEYDIVVHFNFGTHDMTPDFKENLC